MEDHVNYEVKRTGSEFDPIKYFNMFDLSDDLEVKVLKDIGPQKKSVVVIDNFYKDPDSIREMILVCCLICQAKEFILRLHQ